MVRLCSITEPNRSELNERSLVEFDNSNWRRGRHFTWSSEPREGQADCSAKGVPSFLDYLRP